MQFNRSLAGLLLMVVFLGGSLTADAMTLGRARGAVVIGKPLSVAIPLTLDAGESEPCVQADLFQGDLRSGPVEVSVVAVEGGRHAIRVRSTVPIEEPMITIYLRVGCGQQLTRSFVMLAEQVADQASAPLTLAPSAGLTMAPRTSDALQAAQATAPVAPAATATAPAGDSGAPLVLQSSAAPWSASPRGEQQRATAAAQAPQPRPPTQAAKTPARRSDAATTPPRPRHRAAPTRESAVETARPRGPRLRLEPVDLAVEQAAPLKLTPQLAGPAASRTMVVGALPGATKASPSASAPASPTAASASAASMAASAVAPASAPPANLRAETSMPTRIATRTQEEMVGEIQRSQAVEAEMRAMREAMQKYTVATTQLAEQLDKVRGERDFASTLLAVIAGILIAGGVAALWLRSREASTEQARWRQMAGVPGDGVAPPVAQSVAAQPSPVPAPGQEPVMDDAWDGGISHIRPGGDASHQDAELRRPQPVVASGLSDFEATQVSHSHLPKPTELIDIEQKVEFFLAIGQHERAIELLEQQRHDHLGSSPLVWLDLLDLCHQFGKEEQYERVREEFEREFNVRLPGFEESRPQSIGLEDHPRALSRIERLWGSPRVLEAIEFSLFEDPDSPDSIAFDLQASRDLLLLYVIARETLPQPDGYAVPPEDDYTEFVRTSFSPMPGEQAADHFEQVRELPDWRFARPAARSAAQAQDDEDTEFAPVSVSPDIDLTFADAPAEQLIGEAPPESQARTAARREGDSEFGFEFEPRPRLGKAL